MAVAIRTEALSRRFGARTVLDGLDLEVEAGTIFGFLGPNGAGKTTTMHLLLGLLRPDAGRAEVLGLDPHRQGDEVRRRSGALLEHAGLYERLTAQQNLEFQGRLYGMIASRSQQRARELLEAEGLWERRNDRVGTWSRGMKQRLAIARTLVAEPEVVFLDEPTAGFDPQAAVEVRNKIRAMADRGVTVFLNTHNLDEAERLCDQVGVLFGGKLLAVGPPGQLQADEGGTSMLFRGRFPKRLATSLEEKRHVMAASLRGDELEVVVRDGHPTHTVVAAVVRGGGKVEEVERRRSTLEQDFLALLEASQ